MLVLRTLLALRFQGRSRLGLLALFAVATLATIGVVAGLEVRSGAGGRLDVLYQQTGRPDLIVGGGPNAVPVVVDDALAAGSVEAATIYDVAFVSFPRPDGTAVGMEVVAVGADPGSVAVGSPVLLSGRWPNTPGEFVLDAAAAAAHDHVVGSVVQIERNGVTHDLTVVGTATDLSGCFYPTCLPLRGYATADGLASVAPEGTYARAHLRLPDAGNAPTSADRQAAIEALRESGRVDAIRPWDDLRSDLLLPGRVFSAFLAGFGVFVLLATLLMVASTAFGSVVSRRREHGLLKALGVSPSQLVVVTVLEHVVVGVVGVLVGWIVGSLLAPWLQLGLVDVLGRAEPNFSVGGLAATGLAVCAVLLGATIAPARKAGLLSSRDALADAPPVSSGRVRSSISSLPLSPPSQLGLQLALARPVRAVLASAALAVAIAAGLAGWRLSSAVETLVEDPARVGDPYDVLVGVAPTDAGGVAATLASVDGVQSWYTESAATGQHDGIEIGVRGIGDRIADAGLVVAQGRMPQHPGEALVGWTPMEQGRIAIGDTVEVVFPEGALTVTIVGRHGDLDHGGNVVVVSKVALESAIGPSRHHWRVAGDGAVGKEELARRIEAAFGGSAVVQPAGGASGQLAPFRIVLAVLVGLVGAVAAANLGATIASGMQERRREFGVVRALGFSSVELRRQAASSGVALGLVGVVLGVPLGLVASGRVIDAAVSDVGLGPGLLAPAVVGPTFVAAVVGLAGASAVAVASTHRLRSTPAPELVRQT